MSSDQPADIEELRDEVVRLRAENARLRSRSGVAEPVQELTKVPTEKPAKTPTEKPAKAPVEKPAKEPVPRQLRRVLLLPDSSMPVEPGKLGPEVVANLARVLISILSKRQTDVEWRAEHELARVAEEEECFQLADVVGCMLGTSEVPRRFRLEQGEDGQRELQRCLVGGESDSDCFSAGYERKLQAVRDLLAEGEAAAGAKAGHHAAWAVLAVDLVLAELKLALTSFRTGRDGWRAVLETPRPEYDPPAQIAAEAPVGA
jgi:hypothetical protein